MPEAITYVNKNTLSAQHQRCWKAAEELREMRRDFGEHIGISPETLDAAIKHPLGAPIKMATLARKNIAQYEGAS